ncbi:hypothetical protein FRACA_1690011 [Frankia canadensis]|uniref:Uncharacterized protein n=1 Tax=Frankia canadensis TaxID=1836972 RepID=A0A2I2KMY9_9ACTN|nr:hypothetical protein FRACA_1690011 [Frankia canadensis]SOU54324.1 hypothetical protein FRACA_1690011 [Frankia canadensis]
MEEPVERRGAYPLATRLRDERQEPRSTVEDVLRSSDAPRDEHTKIVYELLLAALPHVRSPSPPVHVLLHEVLQDMLTVILRVRIRV